MCADAVCYEMYILNMRKGAADVLCQPRLCCTAMLMLHGHAFGPPPHDGEAGLCVEHALAGVGACALAVGGAITYGRICL